MESSVLIVGASARAAAFSARRVGLRPTAIDLFADRDLVAVCEVQRVPTGHSPVSLPALARKAPPGPWFYTGGLENRPDVVEQIARDRPLWGNDAACLRRVRDPFALCAALQDAGIPWPAVREVGDWTSGRWLVKPLGGSGGTGIRFARRTFSGRLPNRARRAFLQEFIDGESRSAVLLAGHDGCRLLGVTRQLVGIDWLHAAPFRYAGSIGPLDLTVAERTAWERLGGAVTASTGLRGLFGIDAILRDGVPWPVEVNPRYTASVEVIEYATGIRTMNEHRQAFETTVRAASASHGSDTSLTLPARTKTVGKGIWYAPRPVTFPADGPWEAVLRRPPVLDEPPQFADIPAAGDRIAAGRPVLTYFAIGASVPECESELRQMARELDARFLR